MFIFGDILITMAKAMHTLLGLYQLIIVAVVILSWVKPQTSNEATLKIFALLHKLTDPVFNWVRQLIIKKSGSSLAVGSFDFTPLLVLFVLFFLDTFFYSLFMHLGLRMTMGFMGPDVI